MKTPLLLPMLASLCLTAVANSQNPDQPRRDSEPRREREPEVRRDSPEARKPRPDMPRPEARPELRLDEGRHFSPGEARGERHPDFRRPNRPRPVPPEIQELREQVQRLTMQVRELRELVERRDGFKHHKMDRRGPGPGPDSRGSRPPMPPTGDTRDGDHRPHGDGPKPQGDGPKAHGDHRPEGNPPPR
jgi:hypothetical protein